MITESDVAVGAFVTDGARIWQVNKIGVDSTDTKAFLCLVVTDTQGKGTVLMDWESAKHSLIALNDQEVQAAIDKERQNLDNVEGKLPAKSLAAPAVTYTWPTPDSGILTITAVTGATEYHVYEESAKVGSTELLVTTALTVDLDVLLQSYPSGQIALQVVAYSATARSDPTKVVVDKPNGGKV